MLSKLTLQEEPNPIGTIQVVEAIEDQLVALAEQWDSEMLQEESKWFHWLMPWKWGRKVNMFRATDFLLKALDSLINMADEWLEGGADKKATVLDAIDRLYDYVIREALPIYLKPFAGAVKQYIIYTLISVSIDWIVDKYRNGAWRDKIKPSDGGESVEQ